MISIIDRIETAHINWLQLSGWKNDTGLLIVWLQIDNASSVLWIMEAPINTENKIRDENLLCIATVIIHSN